MILTSRLSLVRFSALALALALVSTIAFADALEDWQKIVTLDSGPRGAAQTRDEARKLMIQHFDQQERALRGFIAAYPADSHNFETRMRLSHLLAIRSDLEGKPAYYTEARKILDNLEKPGGAPPDKLADVAYARITLYMHNTLTPDSRERDNLMGYVRKFQKDFPGDHRSGALLAEMATLYDADPKTQREILDEAMRYADTDVLKRRINDDFKRLSMLGKPLALKFDSVQGAPVDIATYRGKVVLVYFFANWAPPSVFGLIEVKRIVEQFPKTKFQVIAISLDENRATLDATLKKTGIDCPIFFDGKGWESPFVRSLGINALPTAWLVDKAGNLRSLKAMDRTEAMIRELVSEK